MDVPMSHPPDRADPAPPATPVDDPRPSATGIFLPPLHERPVLRGRLHQVAAIASAFGLLWLVRVAATTPAKVAAAVYGVSCVLLYLASTSYHVFSRSDRARLIMRRIDHSMIYVLIAGTFTPICILAMDGWTRWVVLGAVWAGALFGVLLKALASHRFRRFTFALYLVLGWAGIAALPALVEHPTRFALVVIAGLLYTVGAILFGLRWPLPSSRWFGYHEVWHSLVVAAGVLLFAVNFGIISGAN
jgi:hemolysin III